jgi:hypothetical protein
MKKIFCLISIIAFAALGEETQPAPVEPTQPVVEAPPVENQAQPESDKQSNEYVLTLGVSYNFRTNYYSDKVVITGSATEYTYDMDYAESFSYEADLRKTPKNAWGTLAGLSYISQKSISSGTVSGGGQSVSVSSNGGSKIQSTVLYGNAVYRWEQQYAQFGLNYSTSKFTPADSFTGSSSASGGLGYQGGFGYYINKNVAVEANLIILRMDIKSNFTNGTETNTTPGFIRSMSISAKYMIK